ncbi:tRNA:m(4)X modification enzyme TRM13 homolog [Trichogramma pretiosum]|uniref:tRNA:m(4)X modification enzyme TRM13 homolog n=1 Tax=Trichogramma pretiosum TaxID=7493 RepID=UPI0006C9B34F|nr:tRNA:m(4)X modification enzyme TRM13 homolog [Trichogramma pretiosum]
MVEPEHCHFYVQRKMRYCKMTVKKGRSFCGEHEPTKGVATVDERIPCPLDPGHTIYRSKLSKHLKVCNAKIEPESQPSYIVKGINLGEPVSCNNDQPLSNIDQQIIDNVLKKIEDAYAKLPAIEEEILTHEVLKTELENSTYGAETRRHLLQTASLLGHLKQADLVNQNTCYIEFGAGKGKLTYWLGQSVQNIPDSTVLLIDRSSHRHKKDNKLKNDDYHVKVIRIRADIADLKLNNISEIKETPHKVAIAKHICGAASDLTLRCMTNSIKDDKTTKAGVVVAFCCHHRCEYSHYVGYEFLKKEGFTPDEFPILCKIASWATCGIKLNNENDSTEREKIGQKVKMLLNWGRLEYLESFGFKCKLVYYIKSDSTLENVCIVGKLNRNEASDQSK